MGVLSKISGPVIQAEGMQGSKINELVKVGELQLSGEIIALKRDRASIQVYEDTSGLKPGEKVDGTGAPLSVELGPGLLGGVFDGIQRPLDKIKAESGNFIARGISVVPLDRRKKWDFQPAVKKGDVVQQGDVLGTVKEFSIEHRILAPKGVKGKVEEIHAGKFTVTDTVARVGGSAVAMLQKWPVRSPREYKEKKHFEMPLVTGKRIVDTFFPIAKGGTAAIPGPFGSGKCVSGETPVLLQDGSTRPIREIFEEAERNGRVVEETRRDKLVESNAPIRLWSHVNGRIITSQTRFVYRDKSDSILRIRTSSGRAAEVTPIHKLFVQENSIFTECEATKLQVGARIACVNLVENACAASGVVCRQVAISLVLDKIVSIEELPGPHDVFDFVLPGIENFVGGWGGVVLHNTVNQTDLAKYADADIVVYVGCGERGNEMTEVLATFPKLVDPRNNRPLMERTVLIANTSNMPVAAREASIYTGITIAEYYRDMGYDVALMADSTSRWAEAMREISGRMEEMPGEEGYPAYLGKKLAEFYERAGRVWCLCKGKRDGSVSVVGAVSPPGGDLSEPVSQATLRVTKVFWALDANLSRRRHYPAINWLRSYSLYGGELREWYAANVSPDFYDLRAKAMSLLQKEAELQNIVQLIGPDALPDKERLVLEATKMIREDFLQQNSYDEVDVFSPPKKQFLMLKTILHFYAKAEAALATETPLAKILECEAAAEIAKLKRVPAGEVEEKCKQVMHAIDKAFGK
ncbi:MAG: V-type ATP synthase subunit A [Candidatus Micrarchaeota archaeon]